MVEPTVFFLSLLRRADRAPPRRSSMVPRATETARVRRRGEPRQRHPSLSACWVRRGDWKERNRKQGKGRGRIRPTAALSPVASMAAAAPAVTAPGRRRAEKKEKREREKQKGKRPGPCRGECRGHHRRRECPACSQLAPSAGHRKGEGENV